VYSFRFKEKVNEINFRFLLKVINIAVPVLIMITQMSWLRK